MIEKKTEYATIRFDTNAESAWVYSATEFRNALHQALTGQTLKKVFVSFYGYLEANKRNENDFNFSYRGGTLLLLLDSSVLELVIHGLGMMEYRLMPAYEARVHPCTNRDRLPSDFSQRDDVYYDLGQDFGLRCCGQTVDAITVEKTNVYPFPLRGFDETLASEAEARGDLPQELALHMDNGVVLRLQADELEYFYVKLEED